MRSFGILTALTLLAVDALAAPGGGLWRRQTLVGENPEYYFRYVTVSEHPPTHYAFRRTQRLEKVRKSDLSVLEHFPLRDVAYAQDMASGTWSEQSVALPLFDLAGYLARNAVHLPFSDDVIRTFSIDSTGVWELFEDGRVELVGRADLRQQIPNLGDDPRVVGIESTDFEPGKGGKAYVYLRVWSNSAAADEDWSEDLLLVNRFVFR